MKHLAAKLALLFLALTPICQGEDEMPTFLTSECGKTRYPEKCVQSLKGFKNAVPGNMMMTSLSVGLNNVMSAHEGIISMTNRFSLSAVQRAAWSDCAELFEDSLSHLNICATTLQKHSSDMPLRLSAALTNFETCRDAFSDLKIPSCPFADELLSSASNMSKLVSNSLSFLADDENQRGRRRRRSLLSSAQVEGVPDGFGSLGDDGFPKWVSAGDRRLLQSSSPASEANVVVAKDGSGKYTTISDAVNAAPQKSSSRYIIYVKAGTYTENVEISKKLTNIMFVGDGIGKTIVTGSKNVQDGTTTFRSATFAVSGSGFIAKGMTFRNTAGPAKHQAVALRVGGDKSVVYSCSIEGYQDTLYVYSMRQFYSQVNIYGTVDFIFGNAAAVIQNSNIYARKPMSNQYNTLTAQGRTDPNENTGISIHRCTIAAAESLGSTKTYLGRPWKEYSRTVFMVSSLGSLIDPAGWIAWNGNFALDTLYYAEYQNSGAGADTSKRVAWKGFHVITSASVASQFTVSNFIGADSWVSSAGVSYTAGL